MSLLTGAERRIDTFSSAPHSVHVDVLDTLGEPVASLDLLPREVYSVGAAITGEEASLEAMYDPRIVHLAYHEVRNVIRAAVAVDYHNAAAPAMTADPEQVAWDYVTKVQHAPLRHSFLQPTEVEDEDDEATVKMSAEDLFGDDDEDDDIIQGAAGLPDNTLATVYKDVAFHAALSSEYQTRLVREDAEVETGHIVISIDAAKVAANGLALQAGHTANPLLSQEIKAVEAKLNQSLAEAARFGAASLLEDGPAYNIGAAGPVPGRMRRLAGALVLVPTIIAATLRR